MGFSFTKIALAAAIFSFLGVDAVVPIRQRDIVIQVASDSVAINGAYIIAQKRTPTYGTVLDLSKDSATPFYLGHHGGIRSPSRGKPRFAEQTSDESDSRVYFSTVKYGVEVGTGFTNVTCSYGEKYSQGVKQLLCSCGGRTGMYGCTGTDENSGLFIYDTSNPPAGPTSDPENCFLISGLAATRVDLSSARLISAPK